MRSTEKKPFFHVLPGSDTLTFGMLGCLILHCAYCQNWLTSQALALTTIRPFLRQMSSHPDRLLAMAKAYGAAMVGSSYNEPLIPLNGGEVFKKARPEGFSHGFHFQGQRYAAKSSITCARGLTAYKIDLKSMSDRNYRSAGGVVDNILDTGKDGHDRGFWEEIVRWLSPALMIRGRIEARG